MFNQVCKEGFYPSGEHSDEERELGGHEAAAADGRSLKDGSIVLEDGTKIDAEAAGTFALGYVASAGQQSADVGVDGSLDSEGNATPSTM